MKKNIWIAFFYFLSSISFAQSKIYTISNVNIDSEKVNLSFNVFANDSIVYPLDANPDYINIFKMENNFYNIVLEKFDSLLFRFEIYSLGERIEYILDNTKYGKKSKTKMFNLNRSIAKYKSVIEAGIYRVKLTLDLGKYNKGLKKYNSEYLYFKIDYSH